MMFHRIHLDAWVLILPRIGLWIFLIVFLFGVLRAFLMPKKQLRHLESLPLDQDEKPRHEH